MSVVALWNDQEIKASYMPSGRAVVIVIVVFLLIGVIGVVRAGGKRRVSLISAWANALLFGFAYVCLAQLFARELCVEAPLYVKVHGLLKAPFFLATSDTGLFLLVVLFVAANVLAMRIYPEYVNHVSAPVVLNAALAVLLGLAVLAAYVAVCIGVGVG